MKDKKSRNSEKEGLCLNEKFESAQRVPDWVKGKVDIKPLNISAITQLTGARGEPNSGISGAHSRKSKSF